MGAKNDSISKAQICQLTLEHLKNHEEGKVDDLASRVWSQIFPDKARQRISSYSSLEYGPIYSMVQEFLWQLVVRGLLVWGSDESNNKYPIYRLTELGKRVASSEAGSHPAHPDFVARVVRDCQNLPAEVIARLEDACDCFHQGLHRAAVVMLRLGHEQMIRILYEDFNIENNVPNNLKPGKRLTANKRLEGLAHVLKKRVTPSAGSDDLAMCIANLIRQSGNMAAHEYARDFEDAAEVEDLLILAGGNIRRLWSLRDRLSQLKNIKNSEWASTLPI